MGSGKMTPEGMRSLTAAVLLLIGTAILAFMSHMDVVESMEGIETAQASAPLGTLSLEGLPDR